MWISDPPSTVNGTKLGVQEWRDSLFLSYGIDLPDLPYHCDGFGADFSIYPALDCKKGGLIMARHNELHNGVADLAGKAFTPAHMHDDSEISIGCATQGGERKAREKGKEERPPE